MMLACKMQGGIYPCCDGCGTCEGVCTEEAEVDKLVLYDDIDWAHNEIKHLTAKLIVETLKAARLKEQITKMYLRNDKLLDKLSRYESGIEVEGYISAIGILKPDEWDVVAERFNGKRVKVLVMKEEKDGCS